MFGVHRYHHLFLSFYPKSPFYVYYFTHTTIIIYFMYYMIW